MKGIYFFIFLFFSNTCDSQVLEMPLDTANYTLSNLMSQMNASIHKKSTFEGGSQIDYEAVNDSLQATRKAASETFVFEMQLALEKKKSFQNRFPELKILSILYPLDSTFRILTWQFQASNNVYEHFGFLQFKDEKRSLIRLLSKVPELDEDIEYEQFTEKNWLGAYYYSIKEFENESKNKSYLLFGYDGFEQKNHRKYVEVLTISDNQIKFGAPIFLYDDKNDKGTATKKRLVLQYSSDVVARLNYDEDEKMIIYDHLNLMNSIGKEPTQTAVPDGTYEAFKYKKGTWHHVTMLKITNMKTAPRPAPILDNKKRKKVFER